MPRLLGQSCASLSYAVGQALAPQAPNFCYSLQSRGRVSSHSPQRQVSERRLSATSKDPPVWDGRQPSWRAPPSWDLLMEPLSSWPSWISARVRSHSRLGPEGQKGHLITNALARPFSISSFRLADLGGKANRGFRINLNRQSSPW